jgi:release factor glutamine methyltransferase
MKPKSIKFAAMTIHEANLQLLFRLYELYDDREAANIADLVMENVTGWKRIDRVTNKQVKMSDVMTQQLHKYTQELLTHKPVQYVLHEAWFAGMKLYVDENVLIPRPETEEMVDLIAKNIEAKKSGIRKKEIQILDIGTGSGCIAIALKKRLRVCEVYAIDISSDALTIAEKNNVLNNTKVKFLLSDIFEEITWNQFSSFDCIVSNPPYIPSTETKLMSDNVTKFEPHLALFVPDSDPLKFYKAIARFAERKLSPGGSVFVEVHENFAKEVKKVFSFLGDVQICKDMQGKERFLIASHADPSLRSG